MTWDAAAARLFPAGESDSAFLRLFLETKARSDLAIVHEESLWRPLHLLHEAFLRLLVAHIPETPQSWLLKSVRDLWAAANLALRQGHPPRRYRTERQMSGQILRRDLSLVAGFDI
jgi:hypothetical protein